MSESDDKLRSAYRGLAREEPPAALDEAILAASRRAVARPSFTRRWAVPVSLAAVLVLAIGVTLEMQHEQPGVEVAPPTQASAPAQTSAPAPQAMQAPEAKAKREEATAPSVARPAERAHVKSAPAPAKKQRFAPSPEPAASAPAVPAQSVPETPPASFAAPQAATVAPPQAAIVAPPQAAPAPVERAQAPSPPAAQGRMLSRPEARAAKRAAGANAIQDVTATLHDPRAELERIARLRAQGHDAEADRALDAFRRDHPGYRIDDATWGRVKPRESK